MVMTFVGYYEQYDRASLKVINKINLSYNEEERSSKNETLSYEEERVPPEGLTALSTVRHGYLFF